MATSLHVDTITWAGNLKFLPSSGTTNTAHVLPSGDMNDLNTVHSNTHLIA